MINKIAGPPPNNKAHTISGDNFYTHFIATATQAFIKSE